MSKLCKLCGNEIPEGRIKALKGKCDTCVECSKTDKVVGFRVISGKNTYTELDIVSKEQYDKMTKLQERKGYGASEGVKTK